MKKRCNSRNRLLFSIFDKVLIVICNIVVFGFVFYSPLLFDYFSSSQSINVLAFVETFAPEAIERFEKETGIKINITYAEIDEQIYARFNINRGQGYDVVNMSDYLVHKISQQGDLRVLEREKISCLAQLDKRLMGHEFDAHNTYSLPHKWYMYGVVYDKNFFKVSTDAVSLGLVFRDPKKMIQHDTWVRPYKICMLDDGRDAMFLAAIYLFGTVKNLDENHIAKIQELLIAQKKWVEAYTVHSSQYFLSSEVTPLALMSSNYMCKIFQATDRFAFAIPREGSLLVIENLTIPNCSKKPDLAMRFINFMLSEENAKLNSTAYGYNSANVNANLVMSESIRSNKNIFPDDETFKRLFVPILPEHLRKAVENMWLAVGFA